MKGITNCDMNSGILNGTIKNYLSSSGTIEPNTFVQIVTSTTIKDSTNIIDGITITRCTPTILGKVWVL